MIVREELNNRLEDYADERGVSVSSCAARILEKFFEEMDNPSPTKSKKPKRAEMLRLIADLIDD